jgi:hypothetical protein
LADVIEQGLLVNCSHQCLLAYVDGLNFPIHAAQFYFHPFAFRNVPGHAAYPDDFAGFITDGCAGIQQPPNGTIRLDDAEFLLNPGELARKACFPSHADSLLILRMSVSFRQACMTLAANGGLVMVNA